MTTVPGLVAILDRAVMDSAFLDRLTTDPIGTLYAEGYTFGGQEIKQLLNLAHATDHEAVKALQQRLAEINH